MLNQSDISMRLILIDSRAGQLEDWPRPLAVTYNKWCGYAQLED